MAADTTGVKLADNKVVYRTIPDKRVELAVLSGANSTIELNNLTGAINVTGKWVYLQARGGDVTVKRGDAITEAGEGKVIADGDYEEFWVDPESELTLNTWGSAACSLDVLYDSKG